MAAKDIQFQGNARKALLAGADLLANAVRTTLGPRGRNVMIEQPHRAPIVTKDGATVADGIELADPLENVGVQMLKEVARQTAESAGDGTTSATVIAQAMLRAGRKCVTAGMDPMDLRRGIDAAVAQVVRSLARSARPCSTRQEIAQVGTVSANGDETIGKRIADAMERVGRNGVITLEDGTGLADEMEYLEGMQFDRGFLSAWFVNQDDGKSVVLEQPYVLLVDGKVSRIADLVPLLEEVSRASRPLLIIADDVDGEALAALVVNSMRGIVKSCVVKSPGFGDRRKGMLEDIAVLCGATVITEELGLTLAKAGLPVLGTARRVEVRKDSTALIGGAGNAGAIVARVQGLRAQLADATAEDDKTLLGERIGRLTGGVAVIRIGGSTELEIKARTALFRDALSSTRAAIEEGIVAGGGVALLRARLYISKVRGASADQGAGGQIVHDALEAPFRCIVANSGMEPSPVLARVVAGRGNFGFNVLTEDYDDMLDMGLIDPVKVVRCGLQNAASVAGLLLTSAVAVTTLRDGQSATQGMSPGFGM